MNIGEFLDEAVLDVTSDWPPGRSSAWKQKNKNKNYTFIMTRMTRYFLSSEVKCEEN